MNGTSQESILTKRSDVQIAFEVFFAIAIQVATVVGNLLVVYAIHRRTRLNTVTNILIENLAWTDICMAVFHMPFWIVSLWYGRLLFDQRICQIAGSTLVVRHSITEHTVYHRHEPIPQGGEKSHLC